MSYNISNQKFFSDKTSKRVLLLLISVITFYILYSIIVSISALYFEVNPTLLFLVLSVKDFFQILFFITIGSVGVLSYIRAKKTLFTPIKTEVFKLQIEDFRELLSFLRNEKKEDILDVFDFHEMIYLNTLIMVDDYTEKELKSESIISDELKKKITEMSTIKMLTQDAIKELSEISFSDNDKKNVESLEKKWSMYKYSAVTLTKKNVEASKQLNHLKSSPLLPEKIKNKLNELEDGLINNKALISDVITEVAQELPRYYNNITELRDFDPSIVWNLFNSRLINLQEISNKVLLDIRDYLKVEELTKT